MIDLHTHILPGVDDGAESLEEALDMCRRAAEEGCQALVATPHQRHPQWWNDDRGRLDGLRRHLQGRLGPTPRLLAGGELRVDSAFLDDLDRLPASGLFSIAGSRYLLIEFARTGIGPSPEGLIHELVMAGWRPILAHPELLPWLARDLDRLEGLVSRGARLQLTAMSITGDFGAGPRRAAEDILEAGIGHFLASDCHGLQRRPPGLRSAYRILTARWGEELAWRLTTGNPQAVLRDRPLAA